MPWERARSLTDYAANREVGPEQRLREISLHVARGSHGLVLMGRAGWHETEKLHHPAPPRSPELNPVENVWQYLRQSR